MPLPDALARMNRRVVNPVVRTFAGRLPPMALVVHRGRRSGREYRTPVMAFPRGDGYVITLPYGAERDWVRNVLAAGGCTLVRRGRFHRLTASRVLDQREGLPLMPRPSRPVLKLLGIAQFLQLHQPAASE
jgi:deazaflavin-dependent oxidoreductase (nitroreductase family)